MDEVLFDVPAQSDRPGVKPICGGQRFRDLPGREQLWLAARGLDELVSANDPVRAYDEIIDELDVSEFEAPFRGWGAPA